MDETKTGGEAPTLEATVSRPGQSDARAGGRLVAALIGGVLGALLVLVVGWTFGSQAVDDRIRAALDAVRPDQTLPVRLAAVEARESELQRLAEAVDGLGARLGQAEASTGEVATSAASLGERVASLEAQAAGPRVDPTAIEELRSRIAAIDEAVERLEERPVAVAGPTVDLAPLQTAQEDLRKGLEQAVARVADQAQATTALVGRVDTLTTALAETEQRLNDRAQQLTDRLYAAEAALGARGTQADQIQATVATVQAMEVELSAQVAASQRALSEVRDRLTQVATEVDTRLGTAEQTLNRRLEEALGRLSVRAGRDTATVVTAVALTGLSQALESGAPFQDAVELLRAHGEDDPALSRAADLLAEPAATGVATRQELLRDLAAIERPGAAAPAEGAWWEQTRDNVLGLISVRREGEVGERPEVRSAGEALARGDLDAAIRQIEPLAAQGGAPVAAWLERARQRRDAEAAVATLREQLGRLAVDAG